MTMLSLVAALVWIGRYLTLGNMPGFADPLWLPWFDQSLYLRSTLAFAHGNLAPGAHWYPLLYPLVAMPFAFVLPSDPFFLLDLLLYLATWAAFARIAGRLGVSPALALICFLATTIAQTGLASAWAHPWTSTLSAALIWWLIAAIESLRRVPAGQQSALALAIGLLIGALPLVRPLDALIGAPAFLVAVVLLLAKGPAARRSIPLLIAGAACLDLAYLALHLAIYGRLVTPYMTLSAEYGFIPRDLGWKAYVLLVSAEPWFPGVRSILQVLPWIVVGVAGLIVMAIRRPATRFVLGLVALFALPVSVLMLTYADLQPPGLWEYTNIHYFKWPLPMLGLGVAACWQALRARASRRLAIASLVLLVLPLGIRIVPEPVDDTVPARMLLYRGRTDRDWATAYFAPVVIRDDGGVLRNVSGFHQIPDDQGARAIAIRRLIGRTPRRYDPTDAPQSRGQLPYRRLAGRVTYLGL